MDDLDQPIFTVSLSGIFLSTYYLPFVRRKPSLDALESHPYRLMWYDMTAADFVPEPGSLISGYGRFNRAITEELTRLRIELRKRVDTLIQDRHMSEIQSRELRHCSRALQYSSITLETAPAELLVHSPSISLLSSGFSSKTLACYEYFTVWEERKTSNLCLYKLMSLSWEHSLATQSRQRSSIK